MDFTKLDISDRIKYLREDILKIKQADMSLKIGLKQGSFSDIERKKTKTVTDRVINDISRIYGVNTNWLKDGSGDIFIDKTTFDLDDYTKLQQLTPLEYDIIKGYLELDVEVRHKLMEHFKGVFLRHVEVSGKE